jgi:APA family basic amino acid/polyamine antiporter
MSSDGLFFRAASRLNAEKTPFVAVIAQASVATFLVLAFKDLQRVLDYTTFAIVLATIADTSALYVLRMRKPGQPRPYRAAGYPIVPALYLLANIGIAISMFWARPRVCLAGVGVLLSGLPVYLVFARTRRAETT